MSAVIFIYESKRPEFAIGIDKYNWVLAEKVDKKGVWSRRTFYPTLRHLVMALFEDLIKKGTKKSDELISIESAVMAAYSVIDHMLLAEVKGE